MRKLTRPFVVLIGIATIVTACKQVPYTGRRALNVVPEGMLNSLGEQSFREMTAQMRVVEGTEDARLLDTVGRRIATVSRKPDYEWTTALIDEHEINAWALPGGYIGFYTGILPVLRHEAGMSFVMGHEVGHALAQHAAERLTQQLALIGGLTIVEAYLAGRDISPEARRGIVAALGIGAEVGILLPYSRAHEAEADSIGLMLMSQAGYPPSESVALWDRMSDAGGPRPPSFLATHPSPEARQENLREWMPRAQKRFQRNRLPHDTTRTLWTASGRVSEGEEARPQTRHAPTMRRPR